MVVRRFETKSALDALNVRPSLYIARQLNGAIRMICKACQSTHQGEFQAEINIHFSGKENLDKPTVWVFPKLLICLDCGFTEFRIPKPQLEPLAATET
jgi:hypothetical protein